MVMRLSAACVALLFSMVHPLPLAAQVTDSGSHDVNDVAIPSLDIQSPAVPLPAGERGPLKRAVEQHLSALAATASAPTLTRVRKQSSKNEGWIGRHPVLFGAAVGFWAGFLLGFLPGDDGVFDDFDATFNGMVLGGLGAGAGAATGAIVGAARR
jgi:hypothetical protein